MKKEDVRQAIENNPTISTKSIVDKIKTMQENRVFWWKILKDAANNEDIDEITSTLKILKYINRNISFYGQIIDL